MKVIDKQNFFPIICICFTLLSIGNVILEAIVLGKFGNDQQNLLLMLLLSVLAVAVLSQHYRFGNFPLLLVILVQYLLLIGIVMLITWISSFFESLHESAYRDMFLSFTIPYIIGAIIYYVSLFFEIKHANKALEEIRGYQNEKAN
ncbi:MAG: hypothetical protein K2H52_06620 [Lachnospiraceae bacterium]|nr:hypothetical protein [Lachnospiraceae bacterium]MDE6184536.1 hypothetical protein [Lachnospiraceae bacterium]MDE7286368.1 hypothetical protein [Lachnospiraceae bacterium]